MSISKKARERKLQLFMERNMGHMPEPTYHFNIGDKVVIGNLENVTISDVISDKVYEISYSSFDGIYRKSTSGEKNKMFVSWHEIRPYNETQSESLVKNNNVRLQYLQQDLSSLLHKTYFFGINFNPEYQRDFVWTHDDKVALIDSIFNNIDIGKLVFVDTGNYTSEYLYEILDGKQRLQTILDFYENRFSYRNLYYNDLCHADKNHFERFSVSVAEVERCDIVQTMKYFVMLNKHGRIMSEEQINAVEEMIKQLEKKEKCYHCS